jgi:MerR family transcriptional regulator/heat shock protein HspR
MAEAFAPAQVGDDEPCYVISVAARMVGVHAQTLRAYERQGLLEPARSGGNIRLYSRRDVAQARWMRSLMEDLGINLAGVEVILRLNARIAALERRIAELEG